MLMGSGYGWSAEALSSSLVESLRSVRLVLLDFDGVLTDNRVIVSESGEESVVCSRADGIGIARLRELGIPCCVVSSEENAVVERRCEKLGVRCFRGVKSKVDVAEALGIELGVSPGEMLFVGNDVNDLDVLRFVGLGVAVADAVPEVQQVAGMVLECRGGLGAVREICDRIAAAVTSAD